MSATVPPRMVKGVSGGRGMTRRRCGAVRGISIVLVIFGASMMTLLGDFMQEIFAEIARTGR